MVGPNSRQLHLLQQQRQVYSKVEEKEERKRENVEQGRIDKFRFSQTSHLSSQKVAQQKKCSEKNSNS